MIFWLGRHSLVVVFYLAIAASLIINHNVAPYTAIRNEPDKLEPRDFPTTLTPPPSQTTLIGFISSTGGPPSTCKYHENVEVLTLIILKTFAMSAVAVAP